MNILENKKVNLSYEILDTVSAGIVLTGSEVKSLRKNHGSINDSFVVFKDNSLSLVKAFIPPYQIKNTAPSYDPYQSRKLLLNKTEINEWFRKKSEAGLTIVPIRMYTENRKIKILIGLARGKNKHDKRETSYDRMRTELESGRQAYVICPRISDPDPDEEQKLQLRSVTAEAKRLQEKVFPDFTIGIMHSKMTKQKKEEVMQEFANHEIDILVSTSVIEVGVNVPNASVMIIEGAERFGLSQLHQLRGRIMRSSHQPYCFLFTESMGDVTEKRLKSFLEAKNGFELAEMDLNLRGAGDLLGAKQWGISDLAMHALRNMKLVEYAREEAKSIIATDPQLGSHAVLKKYIEELTKAPHLE